MAITPRTVLSQPVYFSVFSLAAIGVIAMIGIFVGMHDSPKSPAPTPAPNHQSASISASTSGVFAAKLNPHTPCELVAPERKWSSAQWVRHLDCMEARNSPSHVLLGEANMAIHRVGLKPALALRKSNYLKQIAPLEEQIDFLRSAVNGLGVVEIKLVHRLRRALIWRGKHADLKEIRELEEISSRLQTSERTNQCEMRQTDIWARVMVAQSLEDSAIADEAHAIMRSVARQSVQRAVRAYLAVDCANQIHQGKRAALAELTGVAIAAEFSNAHDGHSSLLGEIAASYRIVNIPEFCRRAVPAGVDLRQTCEKRVGDERFLAR